MDNSLDDLVEHGGCHLYRDTRLHAYPSEDLSGDHWACPNPTALLAWRVGHEANRPLGFPPPWFHSWTPWWPHKFLCPDIPYDLLDQGHLVSGIYIVLVASIRFGPPHTQSETAVVTMAVNNVAPLGFSPPA